MMKRPWRVPANGTAILISKMQRQENGQTATVGKCGGSFPPTQLSVPAPIIMEHAFMGTFW